MRPGDTDAASHAAVAARKISLVRSHAVDPLSVMRVRE
jgi:hypothetical protein